MKVWTIANQKGGVGKTTTTITLASILAKRGGRVLVIDFDPHGSLTSYLGAYPDDPNASIYKVFASDNYNPLDQIVKSKISGISLYKSTIMLATVDRNIGGIEGRGLLLKNMLDTISSKFDYVLIDCPPILGVLMINALAACDFIVIPCQAEYLSINGVDRMLGTIKMISKSVNKSIGYIIVPTMFDRRTKISYSSLSIMKSNYGSNLWRYVIPVDTKLRDVSERGQSVIDIFPRTRSSVAYSQLLNDILAKDKRVVTFTEDLVIV